MKWSRTRTGILLASIVIIGWSLLLVWSRRPTSVPKQWLALSRPVFGWRTNAGVASPTVSLRVSNVGPRPVEFQVWWFECRARSGQTLLNTNLLWPMGIRLSRGSSTDLVFHVRPTTTSNDDRLCCYEITWSELVSGVPRLLEGLDRFMAWYFSIFELYWANHWPAEHLRGGRVFGGSIDVADYFRLMHGFTRSQWLEDLARIQTALNQATNGSRKAYVSGPFPTGEAMNAIKAREAFVDYCVLLYEQTGNADPGVAPAASLTPLTANSNAPAGGRLRR